MASPALALIHGEGPRPLTVLIAEHDVWYWQAGVDQAFAAMVRARLGRFEAAAGAFDQAKAQLRSARRRLQVAQDQAAGRRWLVGVSGG